MNDQERIENLMSEIARLSNQVVDLQNERDILAAQVSDSFGDGYYDGFLDGAKHHELTDCNTNPDYLGDDAMRCSEIAESEKASRMGINKKPQHLAEIRYEAICDAMNASYNEIRLRIGKDYANMVENIIFEQADKVLRGTE